MPSGIFALLDDIAMLMDDVAVMTKVAGKKTAGILGDDLAVNAEKATGFAASREIPVLWAITKGSFLNKLVILPVAIALSAFAPWVIEPILIAGGLFLAYEGVEKVLHVAEEEGPEDPGVLAALNPLQRFRGFILYHWMPYDHTNFYKLGDPWWLLLKAIALIPGVQFIFYCFLFALIDRSARHPPALEVAVAHEEDLSVFPLGKDAGAQAHRRHGPHPSGTDAVGGTKQEVGQRHETSGLAAA